LNVRFANADRPLRVESRHMRSCGFRTRAILDHIEVVVKQANLVHNMKIFTDHSAAVVDDAE
jgi:hypothetical protein